MQEIHLNFGDRLLVIVPTKGVTSPVDHLYKVEAAVKATAGGAMVHVVEAEAYIGPPEIIQLKGFAGQQSTIKGK